MTNGRDPAEITRLAIERRMSRRTFLAGTGAGLGALALAAARRRRRAARTIDRRRCAVGRRERRCQRARPAPPWATR